MPEKHKFEKVAKSVKSRINLKPETKEKHVSGDAPSIARNSKVNESEDEERVTYHPTDFVIKHYKPDPHGKVSLDDIYQHYVSKAIQKQLHIMLYLILLELWIL